MRQFVFFAAALALSSAAYAETLNNDTVLTLLGAGLGDEVVIAKIKTSQTNFDLSTDKIMELKKKGVSGPVLAAMISSSGTPNAMSQDSPDPKVPHPSGIYLSGPTKMTRIDSTTATQAKSSNLFGAALTYGIAKAKVKASINGPTARIHTDSTQPVFYFYFDQAAQGLSAAGGSVTSPAEFTLIRFESKKDKRETVIGSVGLYSAQSGIREKDRTDVQIDQISPGVYKVTPTSPLKSGEYGFVSGGTAGGNSSLRVYDFAVN